MDEQKAMIKAEEILAAYGKALFERRVAYADAVLDEYTPDPAFYAEPARRKISHRRMIKRALILVAVLILALGTLIVSVDAVRMKVFNYVFQEHPGHTKLIPSDIEEPEERNMPDFQLGYVPEGYKMVNYDRDHSTLWVDYDNGKEQYIHFSVDYAADASFSIDNDTFVREETRVGEYQAWYFYDDMGGLLIWQMDKYLLTVDGGVGRDEIMKMAKSVVKK